MCEMLGGLDAHAIQRISDREWRLFMTACVRRVMSVFRDERTRGLVDAIEQFADRQITRVQYARRCKRVWRPPNPDDVWPRDGGPARERAVACARQALWYAADRGTCSYAHTAAGWARGAVGDGESEERAQAALLLCLFGNPFRPAAFAPGWRTADVLGLARGIYADRAFDRLPLLADALMDAGCDSDDLLAHCRDEGPHARGCWVVDLLLGKECRRTRRCT